MDSKRVLHNSFALLIVDLGNKVLPLITFPWVVRSLGPEAYGKLGFATAVTGFFGLLASPGFTGFGIREVARAYEPPRTLAQKLMSARLMLALVSYFLLLVFTFTFAPHDWLTRVLLLISGTNFVVTAFDVQWLFIGQSKMWRVSYASIVGQVSYAALVLAFVRKEGDAWLVPVATSVSIVVMSAILIYRARQEFDLGMPKYMPEEWAKFLPICAMLGLASVMSMIYDQIDTVMLRYIRSDVEVGIYAANYRLMSMSMSFLPVLSQVFYPLLSGEAVRGAKNERRYAQWLADASLALALPISTGGFLLAGKIDQFVLGARYAGSEHLLRWLMFNLISATLAVLFGSRLVPHSREKQYLMSVAVGGAVNVVLNLVYIPRYGAMAAVVTTILSQLSVAIMAYYFSRDLEHPDLGRAIALSLPGCVVMGGAIMFVNRVANVHVLLLVGGGALVYGLCFLSTRMIWRKLSHAQVAQAAATGGGK